MCSLLRLFFNFSHLNTKSDLLKITFTPCTCMLLVRWAKSCASNKLTQISVYTLKKSTVLKVNLFTFFTFPLSSFPLFSSLSYFSKFLTYYHSPVRSGVAFPAYNSIFELCIPNKALYHTSVSRHLFLSSSTNTHFHVECCDWAASPPSLP